MSDANDENNNRGMRAPLTLKPRPGRVSAGTVKQSFSHGRSKTVVVETKRRRVDGPGGGSTSLGGPSAAEKRAALDVRPREPAATPRAPAAGASSQNLSAEEMRARQRVIEAARADQLSREAAAREAAARRAEEEARRRESEAAAARAAAPAPAQPVAPQPAPPAAERAAEAAPPRAQTPPPRAEARPERETPRRDDRASTTTYRPERPASPAYGRRVEAEPRADRPPHEGGRPEGRAFWDRPRPGGDRPRPGGDRPPRSGETVRYSA